jgi:hypothetical protein
LRTQPFDHVVEVEGIVPEVCVVSFRNVDGDQIVCPSVGVGRTVTGVVKKADGARTVAPHRCCMPLHRRIHRAVVGVPEFRDGEAERLESSADQRDVIVRVLSSSTFGL